MKGLLIGLGMLAVLGGLLYFFGSNGTSPIGDSGSQTADVQKGVEGGDTADAEPFSGSFADLLRRGGSYECTFSKETNGAKSEGIVYVSGAKIRGNFASIAATGGAAVHSSMIQDGEWIYTWSEALPKGMKVKVADTLPGSGSREMSGEMFNPSAITNYNCKAWKPDLAWFVIPPDVKFLSL